MSHQSFDSPDNVQTFDVLHELFERECANPAPGFVRNLEQRLFQSTGHVSSDSSSQVLPSSEGKDTSVDTPQRSRSIGRFQWASLFALITLVVTSTIWFTGRQDDNPGPTAAQVREASVAWSRPWTTGALPEGFEVAGTDDVIVRLGSTTSPSAIQVVEANTGDLRWEREIYTTGGAASLGNQSSGSIAVDSKSVYLFTFPSTLQALDLISGEELWSHEIAGHGQTVQVHANKVFVWQADNALTVFDAESGAELWTTGELDVANGLTRGPYLAKTAVLLIPAPGELRAYDSETGVVLWSYFEEFDGFNATMASSFDERGETLYLQFLPRSAATDPGSSGRVLIAIDASDGSELWRTMLSAGGNFSIVATTDHVYTVDARLEDQIGTPTAMEEVRGRIYAYDRETGELAWQSEAQLMRLDLTLSPHGILTSLGFDAEMAVIDTASNAELCRIVIPDPHTAERMVTGEFVIMLQADGTMFAIDPVTSCSGQTE